MVGLLLGLLFSGMAQAGEIRAAVGGWHYRLSGTLVDAGLAYDFERDLGVKANGQKSLVVEWQTPPGWWPDLALSYSELDADGRRTVPGMPPLTPDQTLVTDANNDDYDVTLRYPIPWVSWGGLETAAGLSIKYLSSDIRIDDSSQAQPVHESIDQLFPQAHLHLRWPMAKILAWTATVQGVAYQGDQAWEVRAAGEMSLFDPVLVELGWQQKRYEVGDGDYRFDATLRGLLLRVGMRFPL